MCHNAVDLNLMLKETQARVAQTREGASVQEPSQNPLRRGWGWIIGLIGSAIALTSCVEAKPIPQALIDDGVTAVTASRIYARNCPSIAFNAVYAEDRADRLYADLANDGMTQRDLERWVREAPISQMTERVSFHAESLPFELSDQEAVCAAGQREIANQTEIGKHLISN